MTRSKQILALLVSVAALAAAGAPSSVAAAVSPNAALATYLYQDKMVADIYTQNFRNGCRAWGGTFIRKEYWPNPTKWDIITCYR